MKNNWVKTLTKIAVKSKDTIIKYAPQIMAAAGAGCFIAATYCAIKETPKAMEKLEEKMELDPEMTLLQKGAVVIPEYRKTLIFTGAGGALTLAAWKVEATRMAELAGIAAAALKDNDKLMAAAKEVVGEEKTQEIVDRKKEMDEDDYAILDAREAAYTDSDNIPYPMQFPCGVELWMTWSEFKQHINNLIPEMASKKQLRLSDYFLEFGLKEEKITDYMIEHGWQPDADEVAGNTLTDWIAWAHNQLTYNSEAYEYDHYRRISGWKITWLTDPEEWDPHRLGY